jgi:hypothetical protein
MKKLAFVAVIAAGIGAGMGPAAAVEVDYPGLFEQYADKVRAISQDERVLELPGQVMVIARTLADGAVNFTGFDQSGFGPAGCAFDTLVNALAFSRSCEGVLNADEIATLNGLAEKAAGFVAENGFPAAGDNVQSVLEAAIDMASPAPCPAEDNKSAGYVEQLRALTAPEGQSALERMLSQPRLPVCAEKTYPPKG